MSLLFANGWLSVLASVSAVLWLALLGLPWRPWGTRERLESARAAQAPRDFSDTAVLIPARNEAHLIGATLRALARQGSGLQVLVVDDQSSDATGAVARACAVAGLQVIAGEPPPPGWTGKVWALEQARRRCDRPILVLLDADIELADGTLGAMREQLEAHGLGLLSLMARLAMDGPWAKLLVPAFVYFFKLLYPFRLSNTPASRVAAAAGGCIMMRAEALEDIGGFGCLRGELIDDCALARRVKARGHRTWIGLTRGARSRRRCERLGDIWQIVARTAYPQLRYSVGWLLACTLMMALAFFVPVLGLSAARGWASTAGAIAWLAMAASYVPTLRYYERSALWAFALPLIGALYLAMTWHSAIAHWRGPGSSWKGRRYARGRGDARQADRFALE